MSFELDDRGILCWRPWLERNWLIHGFSTRLAGDFHERDPAEAAALFRAPGEAVRTLRQIHSDQVVSCPQGPEKQGDALISSAPLVGVRTADCLPLLLLDSQARAVAAVHAGWRGSAAGIALRAVERLVRDLDAAPSRMEALIGPAISADAYEVGEEVAAQFNQRSVRRRPGRLKPHLDLAAENRAQLLDAGLESAAIHDCRLCTYQRADWFYSYRRDSSSQRMLSAIGIRPA